MSECIEISEPLLDSMPLAIWSTLQTQDPHLPDLPARGIGELRGNLLTVRWARDSAERFFAIEVLDRANKEVWETSVAQLGQNLALSFWRRVMGNDAQPPHAWLEALGDDPGRRPYPLKSEPTFMAVAAAYLSPAVPLVLEDKSVTELLEDDLSYWRGLAKSQAKTIKRMENRQTVPQFVAVQAEDASQQQEAVARVWRLEEMDEWAALNEERIVIMPRAIASARRSPYEKPELVYNALELLAQTYRLTKLGELDRNELKDQADRLGLSIGGSVNITNAGEAGDEYFIRWNKRRVFLDQHLGKGSARDPRFSLRIYYVWDDDSKRVIVGWLPSHLSTGRF